MANPSHPWLVLLCVALGQFMVVVDVTILNIALPAIATELHASMAGIEWAMIGYSLTMIALVPLFGRLSDVFGRKRLYVTGLAVFAAASALAASATSIELLIAARVVQAIGGAFITSNTLAILTDTFPEGKRGVAMGVQSILISGGAAIGPTLGGFLVTTFSWEAVFLVNLPIGAVAATMAALILPPLRTEARRERLDVAGAALLSTALFGLLYGVTKAPTWGWLTAPTLTCLAGGAAAFALFVRRQRRIAHPLVQPSLFRIRAFVAGQLAGTLAMVSLIALTFLMPFYWQGLRGISAQQAGIYMLPVPFGIMILAPISGRISDRFGARFIATLGLCVVSLGLFLMAQIDAATSVAGVLGRYVLIGLGLGMFLAPNNNAIMTAAPRAHRGVASGMIALFRFSGQSLGIAYAGTVFHEVASATAGEPLEPASMARIAADPVIAATLRDSFEVGFRTMCLTVLPLTLLAATLSLSRGKLPPRIATEGRESRKEAAARAANG